MEWKTRRCSWCGVFIGLGALLTVTAIQLTPRLPDIRDWREAPPAVVRRATRRRVSTGVNAMLAGLAAVLAAQALQEMAQEQQSKSPASPPIPTPSTDTIPTSF